MASAAWGGAKHRTTTRIKPTTGEKACGFLAFRGLSAAPFASEEEEHDMQLKHFQEQIFFATVRITIPTNTGKGASIGTGFLYRVSVSKDQHCILLVSNRHVYGDPTKPIQLVFHRRDDKDPNRPQLGQTVILADKKFESVFTGHPDSSIDLACINISKIGHHQPPIFYKNLTDELMPDFQHDRLLPGNDVWFVGYPENRFDTANNLPVLRRGYIASIPKVDFEGRSEFLIDAQVFPGSSGSPVFTSLGNQFKLVGVVSQTMIKNEQLQAIPTGAALGVQQILGLGIVLKASLLTPLLEAATREIRDRLAAETLEPTLGPEEEGEPIDSADG